MTDTQLILIGIATTGIFVSISLIAIMNSLENLVQEIRCLRSDLVGFKSWEVNIITDELMKVVERECMKARNEGYHDCELDRSGTIGCSMD